MLDCGYRLDLIVEDQVIKDSEQVLKLKFSSLSKMSPKKCKVEIANKSQINLF